MAVRLRTLLKVLAPVILVVVAINWKHIWAASKGLWGTLVLRVDPSPPSPTGDPYLPECPTHDLKRGISLSPNTSGVPEFHDCQRLLTGGKYGPLVAIFAAENLMQPSGPGNIPQVSGRAVATILALDDGYPELGIAKGYNCLYLFDSTTGLPNRARMVARDDGKCPVSSDPGVGNPLRVYVGEGSHLENQIPPVARWDYNGQFQYIGVKCKNHWCSVGPMDPAWTPQLSKTAPAGSDPAHYLTYEIKGYHDQQLLAPPTGRDWNHTGTPAAGDWIEPTGILGTVVPEPNVGLLKAEDYANPDSTKRWVKVATTYLEGNSDQAAGYKTKYGFALTPLADTGNEVMLCSPDAGPCPDLPAGIENTSSCRTAAAKITAENNAMGGSSRWYARVYAADGSGEKFLCVIRRSHPELQNAGITMPSTARWRWLHDDDSIWVPCIFSCCHLQGGIG